PPRGRTGERRTVFLWCPSQREAIDPLGGRSAPPELPPFFLPSRSLRRIAAWAGCTAREFSPRQVLPERGAVSVCATILNVAPRFLFALVLCATLGLAGDWSARCDLTLHRILQ